MLVVPSVSTHGVDCAQKPAIPATLTRLDRQLSPPTRPADSGCESNTSRRRKLQPLRRPVGQCGAGHKNPGYMSRKCESFEQINSIRVTNGNFDSWNSCKRLGTSRLHEMHESNISFVTRIEFIRSKLSNFSTHVSGVRDVDTRHLRASVSGCNQAVLTKHDVNISSVPATVM